MIIKTIDYRKNKKIKYRYVLTKIISKYCYVNVLAEN